jgi:hypothetical protein
MPKGLVLVSISAKQMPPYSQQIFRQKHIEIRCKYYYLYYTALILKKANDYTIISCKALGKMVKFEGNLNIFSGHIGIKTDFDKNLKECLRFEN